MRSDRYHQFGYGSLIFSPERPEHLLERAPAVLPGHRRTFNKRSRARACPRARSFDAFPDDVPAIFCQDDQHLSLALGLIADPAASVQGVLLAWPAGITEEVQALTDAREGYVEGRDPRLNGYVRTVLSVTRMDGGEPQPATVYLSNPDPGSFYVVGDEVDLATRAKILINATPRDAEDAPSSAVRGLHYLEGIRRDLRSLGIVDPALEAMAAAVLALPGPWCQLVASP